MPEPRRILMIKPSALGDIVHALPVLRLLRKRYPEATIAWLVNPAFADLLDGHPDLDRIILFRRKRIGATPALIRELRQFKPDVTIDLQGLIRTGFLALSSGAHRRIGFGYARELAGLAYSQRVGGRQDSRHAVERYLDVAEQLDCGRGPVEFVLPEAPLDLPTRPYAVLIPGTNWATKRWPVEQFAVLADQLRERGLTIVASGSPGERPLADAVRADINLAGETSIKQLVTLLRHAVVAVTNDSGPMHIAAAVDTPLLAAFGPTDPRRTGPFARLDDVVRLTLPCAPCLSRNCVHQTCLQTLSAERVLPMVQMRIRGATQGAA
ncbi:MAG: lipopolysaccharide heptosyltransferase II [Planctomycetota bacterium]